MKDRLFTIREGIENLEDVSIVEDFFDEEGTIYGQISVQQKSATLTFAVTIYPLYPFQFHGTETIRFFNKSLIEYNHVNRDGSVCVHTPHHTDLKSKIFYDIESLKLWMLQYYVERQEDSHYDHIITYESGNLKKRNAYLFTELSCNFVRETFGSFKYSLLSKGFHEQQEIDTYIIQGLNVGKTFYACNWSSYYKNLETLEGFYIFLEHAPVKNKRFIIENWLELEQYISQESLKFLDGVRKSMLFRQNEISQLPILIGYKIPTGEVHWQCAIVSTDNFPNYAEKISQGNYKGRLKDSMIDWVQTKNSSYTYFFGRGALEPGFTDRQILLIGAGAVGSIVATTLTRAGCKDLTLVDYDIKEPENVCRSEFKFGAGITGKINELGNTLAEISPFIQISTLPNFADAVKIFATNPSFHNQLNEIIGKYDLIIDCTADNDMAHLFDLLHVDAEIINLSITNYALDLVCVIKPNLHYTKQQMLQERQANEKDLYNPTGCWSPTFRASYNDISLMVQHAVKHINQSYKAGKSLRNFRLTYDPDELAIKLTQF